MTKATGTMWYYAESEDGSWAGPFKDREGAIAEARSDLDGHGFYVAQGTTSEVRIADWIEADDLITRACESIADSDRVNYEFDESVFEVKAKQEADLIARVKRACEEWQAAHGLKFVPNTFEWMSTSEWIEGSG